MAQITLLEMITPFQSTFGQLSRDEQLLRLKGCVLCQITRDVDNDSTRSKDEWRECRSELGVPVQVYTEDTASPELREASGGRPPAVCGVTTGGETVLLMDEAALARCAGSVQDFRGRLLYKIAALGHELAAPEA